MRIMKIKRIMKIQFGKSRFSLEVQIFPDEMDLSRFVLFVLYVLFVSDSYYSFWVGVWVRVFG